jgi:protein FAM32A
MKEASFVGGSLSFKGDKKKTAKKKSKAKYDRSDVKHELPPAVTTAQQDDDDNLTEAERKAIFRKNERERQELKIVAKKSHRERIEEFNQALASVTEHNDIPRVRLYCLFDMCACHFARILLC